MNIFGRKKNSLIYRLKPNEMTKVIGNSYSEPNLIWIER